MISPLAYIHPEAKIGENVEIAPFVFIDKNVVIGDNNKIMANANILYGSRIGNGNTIFPGAVIGAIPQDLKFRGEETTAEIGNNNTIRENVTINRGTAAKGKTIVGSNNLLMEGVHFDLVYTPLKHLGYKSAMVNFSDIYAMNGTPKQITVSLAVPNVSASKTWKISTTG